MSSQFSALVNMVARAANKPAVRQFLRNQAKQKMSKGGSSLITLATDIIKTFQSGGQRKPSKTTLDTLADLLKSAGYQVSAPGEPTKPRGVTPPEVRPRAVAPKKPQDDPQSLRAWSEFLKQQTAKKPGGKEPKQPSGPRTPTVEVSSKPRWRMKRVESSNVWAYGYDSTTETLYVQFKAPAINMASVRGTPLATFPGSGLSKRQRPRGRLGRTVMGKQNKPGPMYAYYGVPQDVWERFRRQTSAGKAVWDKLRIRGTVWGHQYPYELVFAAIVSGIDYVPRRAAEEGYMTRRMTTLEGRKLISVLPQQRGVWDTDERGRAVVRPDRGRPSRGRE